jgi:hypothetical protein
VRVSVADIDRDGPFSVFPGVQRWFVVLQGAGVALTVDGRVQCLARGDAPLLFAGDAAVDCRLLDGPTRDLNLMLRGASGALARAVDGQPWSPGAAQCGLYSAVAGRCRTDNLGFDVPALALLWFDNAPQQLVFEAGARPANLIGWWLAATPRESTT